jgi:hypothetical protein
MVFDRQQPLVTLLGKSNLAFRSRSHTNNRQCFPITPTQHLIKHQVAIAIEWLNALAKNFSAKIKTDKFDPMLSSRRADKLLI